MRTQGAAQTRTRAAVTSSFSTLGSVFTHADGHRLACRDRTLMRLSKGTAKKKHHKKDGSGVRRCWVNVGGCCGFPATEDSGLTGMREPFGRTSPQTSGPAAVPWSRGDRMNLKPATSRRLPAALQSWSILIPVC